MPPSVPRTLERVKVSVPGAAEGPETVSVPAPREVSVPRSALFLPLQAAVEGRRLRVAEGCPYRAELARELRAARGGPSGAESRGAGHHGDLMTAVALAVWWQGLARM